MRSITAECGELSATGFLEGIMSETDDDGSEHVHHHSDHHVCANLFGCADEKGTGIIREDIKGAAFDDRACNTLLDMDEVDQETLDAYLSARGHWRRKFLQASSFMGALAAVEPWFATLGTDRRSRECSYSLPNRPAHVRAVHARLPITVQDLARSRCLPCLS
jgi:hypothetical protein